ncbi:hypothetical protein [Actinokineospora enzanensis]|uniref:hypothetical protein n=1 Tax=Actinokineospora enzanensis TaxID=155975 RepID=UPI000366B3F2|nr:hypothetical protein [Actinokineospora enzanensis]
MTATDTEEPTPVPDGDLDPAADAPPTAPAHWWRNPFLAAATALLVVATALAAWFGIAWLRAANDDDLALARTRDEVARVGGAEVVTVSSFDYRQVDQVLDRWLGATTGAFHDDLTAKRADTKALFEKAKTTRATRLLKVAVTQLDDHAGTAQIMVALAVTDSVDGKPSAPAESRMRASLRRAPDGWKIDSIESVLPIPAG